jgi:hypothetical protein
LQDWSGDPGRDAEGGDQAREQDEKVVEALALIALGEASLKRDAIPCSRRGSSTKPRACSLGEDDPVAHFDALVVRATAAACRPR